MNRLALVCLLVLTGCATRLYSPTTGKHLAIIESNATNVSYSGGGMKFHADTLDNATPTRTAMHGINRITATVAGAAVAVAIPGSGAVPLVSKAAIATVPSFTTPASAPATPAPHAASIPTNP
jgi:hypothetical protein